MKIETLVNAHAATYAYIAAADVWTDESGAVFDPLLYAKRVLQEAAFRARILKVDAQQREDIKELGTALDMVIADVEEQSNEIGKKNETIERLRRNNATFADAAVLGTGFEEKDKQLAILEEDKWNLKDEIRVKDARIAELKAENQAMEYLLNEGENIGVE